MPRTTLYTTFFGEKESLRDVARRIGIDYRLLHYRLFRLKWTEAAAFLTPVAPRSGGTTAPRGVCPYCDRRRDGKNKAMKDGRKRKANREKREKT